MTATQAIGRQVVHATVVVERVYPVSPGRVFAAWADPAAFGNWNVPGGDWRTTESERDFRVSGRDFSRFGPPGDAAYHADGRFLVIVTDALIVSAGTMHNRGEPTSSTLCTVEILAEGSGARLILTDQSAYLGGRENPADREHGWRLMLESLAAALEA